MAGCNKGCSSQNQNQEGAVQPAGGKGEETVPRTEAQPKGAPVETGARNTPELEPAFPGQTRAPAMETETSLSVEELLEGLRHPWALAFLPDGRVLLTEKYSGALTIVSPEKRTRSSPARGVPQVDAGGQGGLLDVGLHPQFADNQLVYLSYYEPREEGNGLAVARARLVDGDPPRLEALKVVFRMKPTLDSSKHAGGRFVFSPKGQLFIGLGDRSMEEGRRQARRLDSHLGKIVRIDPDGSVPQDNPFVDQKDARPEIWSMGHRNVLGLDYDAQGQLWAAEMGPQGGDELNLIQRGNDYGWPKIGYGEEYSGLSIHETAQAPGLEQPVYFWDPVISPGALTIYSGKLLPEWKGDFFIAGLSSQALVRLKLEDERVVGEERLLAKRGDRIREVVEGPDGALYLLTDGDKAQLLRVAPEQ